jgi:hypothetical protein
MALGIPKSSHYRWCHRQPILIFTVTYTTIKYSMSKNTFKSIGIVVITAVVLMLAASPGTAAACKDMPSDNHNSDAFQIQTAVLPCCLTADCLSSNHLLTKEVDNEVILPNRSNPEEHDRIVLPQTSVSTKTPPNPNISLTREPAQELPSYLNTEYRCRSCLDSEEPLQV